MRQDGNERRTRPRLKTLKAGQIVYHNANCVMRCRVLNMSEEGATIQTSDFFDCPATFTLKINSDPTYQCELRWTRGKKLGVRFLDS